LFEDFKVIVDFLIKGRVVLECMYSRFKSRAHSWFMRNGAYIDWKFKHLKKLQKKKKHQKQGWGSRDGEGEGQQKNNCKGRGKFLCVAFFEAPNYCREKELPKILKKCIPHADAIFSSIRDLKEYLKKQLHLPKLATTQTAIAQESQNYKHRMVNLEHFLNLKTHTKKERTVNLRGKIVKECIGGRL
ncbi:MAG: hypothetical protein ACETVN_03150, partial [Asgard group archaeon]